MTRFLLLLIRLYQRTLSPLLGDCCRFEPSCSRYAVSCLECHGAGRGSWLALKRLLRCNPFFRGGIDMPPMAKGTPSSVEPDWERVARLCGSGPGSGPPSNSERRSVGAASDPHFDGVRE